MAGWDCSRSHSRGAEGQGALPAPFQNCGCCRLAAWGPAQLSGVSNWGVFLCLPAAHGCCWELGSREKGWSHWLGCRITPARGQASVPAPPPTLPCQVLSIPEHPQGLATWPTCHHCKMAYFNKKGNIPQNSSARRGGEHHPVPPACCCQLCQGPCQQSGGHRHMGGTGEEAESQRESSQARMMPVGVATVVLGAGVGCDFAAVAPGGNRTRLRRRARVRAGGRDN